MSEEIRYDIPKVPLLKGEENLEEWDQLLKLALNLLNLEEYIEKEHPFTPETKSKRTMVLFILSSSLTHVRSQLKNAGWDATDAKMDPKKLYDLVHRAIPRVSEGAAGQLMKQLCEIKRVNFDSMAKFQDRVQYLKRRLQEMGCGMEEKAMMWIVINGLEGYENLQRFLIRDLNAGTLDWEKADD
ncbi:hypothetical protein QBC33DRAFT_154695 [Phialemonium atrogriseum]|uniref:Uncharacterized protein n=1 Tax=Phialemonium atrogriseum TaxID=1093897 RepID=A0AAJ0CA57_9PEZI|nr:uncharacterized protein QBC33DRAFT_154695 [Phialemonium atrogriseum]KAK1771454.1 hypothetical protein QBC33DRAFT_154695 [Phialemonium atrogriseum]